MLVRNASPRGPMCLRGLMFSLSGHCGLLFYFIFVLVLRVWIYRVWSFTEWACCACDPCVHLSVPSIVLFMFEYV